MTGAGADTVFDERTLVVLGSTGSIGGSTLDVVRTAGGKLRVAALTGGGNVAALAAQAREFRPRLAVIADTARAGELGEALAGTGVRVEAGPAGLEEAAAIPGADLVVSAIVGSAGLLPTWHAVEAGRDVALANKETLVAAGELVTEAARRRGVRIIPLDSEHGALHHTLQGRETAEVDALILTASGGPFWSDPRRDLREVTPADARRHPRWTMGAKISIDSATLMNKGLEVIEACWLFGVDLARIEVLIHPQSLVHSLVRFVDGSFLAHLSQPDMRIPIAAALAYPRRTGLPWPALDLAAAGRLDFFDLDDGRFPAVALARRAFERGGAAPATLNAANETAVEAFLSGTIRFPEIVAVSEQVLGALEDGPSPDTVTEVLAADRRARAAAGGAIREISETRRMR